MPTYAQLQAESWWGREVVTPELDWLGDELCRRTRRPREAAGTKGNNLHLRGAHRSQEWILKSIYCTSRTYTVQSGLTAEQLRHIAGFDFTPGSAEQMIAQCKRLYDAVRSGRLEEVREFYGNVDGDQVVDGWNNVADRAASSDSSHLWHWHLTIDRRRCGDRALMERILAIALGEDNDMTTGERWVLHVMNYRLDAIRSCRATIKVPARLDLGPQYVAFEEPNNLAAAVGRDMTDEPAIIAGVLAGLSPEAIAAAIPAELAEQVAANLAARLQS